MFSKPRYGWSDVSLGNFKGRCSYLTDVPVDILNAFINAIKYDLPASVFFEEEGSEFILVSSLYNTYIISDRKETKLYQSEISIFELAKEVISDIETNLDEWIDWMNYQDYDSKERTFLLSSKIEELKKLVQKHDELKTNKIDR